MVLPSLSTISPRAALTGWAYTAVDWAFSRYAVPLTTWIFISRNPPRITDITTSSTRIAARSRSPSSAKVSFIDPYSFPQCAYASLALPEGGSSLRLISLKIGYKGSTAPVVRKITGRCHRAKTVSTAS